MTQCQLVAEVGDGDRFPELARGWFTGVLADVFPDLGAGLAAGPVLYKRDPRDASVDVAWGEPGAVHASMQIEKKADGPVGRWVQYTPQAWRRFLDGMSEHPYKAVIGISPLDGQGRPLTYEGTVSVAVTRVPQAPQWALFRFSAGANVADVSKAAGRWIAFARRQAETMPAVYGDIGLASPGYTVLEYATATPPVKTIPRARSELRGYSWITLVPPELVGRLGGIGRLRESGAFHAVDELACGAAWLQATAEPGDYDDEAARRVFDVLAPVLIPGKARRPPGRSQPPLAYGVNAGEYRHEHP